MTQNIQSCWIITEGMAGTQNQCIAIADALDCPNINIKQISLKFPFNHLCPHIFKKAPKWAIKGIDWTATKPDIVIASGRKAIPVTLRFKNTFKVFVQDPKISSTYFDLVAVPHHDKLRGDNVIVTDAAPTKINPKTLDKAKSAFDFSSLPKRKIALIIGGDSQTHHMNDAFAYGLFESLLPYLQSGDYGFLITASRRTPEHIRNHLSGLFATPNCYFWDGEGENPYISYLSNADYILVTEDSTSMLSDACSTGKPVYRLSMEGQSVKFNRLYDHLKNRCGLKVFDGELDNWDYAPLSDAKDVADKIKEYFAKT